MQAHNPVLPMGYSPIPPGRLATVVTCLEMRVRPGPLVAENRSGFTLVRQSRPDLTAYRRLFRRVGEDWLWSSRLALDDAALAAILHDPRVEVFVLREAGEEIGLLELDFREEGAAEIAFFGLVPGAIGSGAGWFMMAQALDLAWSRPIARLWVHTCHFDHPKAVSFYTRAGFSPYALMVEVLDDPRLTGLLPAEAAPHVPLLQR